MADKEKIKIAIKSIKNDEINRIIPRVTDHQIKIRLPPFFKQIIDIESKKNGRSKAAEILYRLKISFEKSLKINKEGVKIEK